MSPTVSKCRFVDYTPSGITSIAVSPLPPPNLTTRVRKSISPGTLAIGRANGTISVCEWTSSTRDSIPARGWIVRKILHGPATMKIESIAFSIRDPYSHSTGLALSPLDLRLFSTSGGKHLVEWDLQTGLIKSMTDSYAGAILSIAVDPASTLIALGCEEGSVCLLSLLDDAITPFKHLQPGKGKILSLAWGPMIHAKSQESNRGNGEHYESDSDAWKHSILVAGCSDSAIRKWDVNTGRVGPTMFIKASSEVLLVWAVGVTPDGTIVSGDSQGYLRFWDSVTNTQLQSLPAHGADVLGLAIGPDGNSVYTSSVDQKIAEFSSVTYADSNLTRKRGKMWTMTFARRTHSHDVCAIGIWPPLQLYPIKPTSQDTIFEAPIIVAGSVDTNVITIACSPPGVTGSTNDFIDPYTRKNSLSFPQARPRPVYDEHLMSPGSRVVQIARQAGLVMGRMGTWLSIWGIDKLHPAPGTEKDLDASGGGGWVKLLNMDLKVDSALVSSAISDDGLWLAVADAYETKLFKLAATNSEEGRGSEHIRLKPVRVKKLTESLLSHISSSSVSSAASTSASSMTFTPDSQRLVLGIASAILVLDLATIATTDAPNVLSFFPHHRFKSGAGFSVNQGRIIKSLPSAGPPLDEDPISDIGDFDDDSIDGETLPVSQWPSISRLAVSPDGQWLASADLEGRIHVFHLDSLHYHCSLPTSLVVLSDIKFDPSSPHTLYLAFLDNTLQIFDVETREYPEWAKYLCYSILPSLIGSERDSLVGIAFIPEQKQRMSPFSEKHSGTGFNGRKVLLWSKSWMSAINIDAQISHTKRDQKALKTSAKRKSHDERSADSQPRHEDVSGVSLMKRYSDVLSVDFFNCDEMVVVERPWTDILQTLPPAYFKPRFGRA